MGSDAWDACHKVAWPYDTRPHEGYVLKELQCVEGVVELFAFDEPEIEGMLGREEIHRDFEVSIEPRPIALTTGSEHQQRSPAEFEESLNPDTASNESHDFHRRVFRRTVTAYIPETFSPDLSSLTLLRAWHSLYRVVSAIAKKGWVHRDLSWNNVRITHHKNDDNPNCDSVSVVLIDFDLASRILGPSSGSPDRTGTVAFMPIQILLTPTGIRHHELHEDEAAFWIGFLALISRSRDGSERVNRLSSLQRTLDDVGSSKMMMLSFTGEKMWWDKWFGTDENGKKLKKICVKVVKTQFNGVEGVDMVYPSSEEKDEEGRSKPEVMHRKVVPEVLRVLEDGINLLQGIGEMRRGAGANNDGEEGLVEKVERELKLE
jgi:hypothetical protein